jgi:hypothetical protein
VGDNLCTTGTESCIPKNPVILPRVKMYLNANLLCCGSPHRETQFLCISCSELSEIRRCFKATAFKLCLWIRQQEGLSKPRGVGLNAAHKLLVYVVSLLILYSHIKSTDVQLRDCNRCKCQDNQVYGNIKWPEFIIKLQHGDMNQSLKIKCKIWGFHGGDYEEWCPLTCYAVWLL